VVPSMMLYVVTAPRGRDLLVFVQVLASLGPNLDVTTWWMSWCCPLDRGGWLFSFGAGSPASRACFFVHGKRWFGGRCRCFSDMVVDASAQGKVHCFRNDGNIKIQNAVSGNQLESACCTICLALKPFGGSLKKRELSGRVDGILRSQRFVASQSITALLSEY
jgi:hypothetical protein